MEDQKLFSEDRKGNFHSGKRKSDNSEQTANNTPFKQQKTFNRGASQSHPSKNYRNRKYNDNNSNTFQNRRYPDKKSYQSQNFHKNSFEPRNRNWNRGAPQSHPSEDYRNRKYNDNKSNTSKNRRYPDKKSYSSQNDYNNAFESNNDRNRNTHEEEEKDEKLIDLISYYKKTLKTMKEGLSNEETEIFASNVLTESAGYEVRLSCNPIISHCIEYLLSISKDPTVSRKFMAAFGLEKEEVCTNASASHITELLLNIALQNIQNWQLVLKLEETDPERENVSYFMSWISDFGEFIIENFHLCLQNQFTCHVVCSEIRALGGDMSSATDFMSKKSVNHKKHFRHEFGEESSKAEFFVPVILRDVPELFTKLLTKIAKTFLKMEETELIDCVTGGSSAIVVETLLCILKKQLPKKCKKFISGLATKIFSEKNDDNIPKAFLHKNCSFMVEKMFASANEGLQLSLWNDYIADSLEYLVTHVVGNYVIQRLFDVVESKEQLELMIEKIGSMLEIIRSSGRYGIFASIAGACNRLKAQQAQFLQYIMQCLQCATPETKQIQLVPRLLGFKVCDQPEISICLQGSLLVQATLKFHKPIKVVNSILNMKPQDLAFLASHVQGCHVFHAFFSSNSVGEKSKDKLIQSLKPCIINIALDRNGCLTLSRIWMLLSIKLKTTMANILVQEEKSLNANSNGNALLRKCGIFFFKNDIKKWKEMMNNLCSNTKKL